MTREIKFKVFQKLKNRMLTNIKKVAFYPECIDIICDESYKESTNGNFTFHKDHIDIMQFTGHKDKDKEGKEIYEGDIYRDEFSIDDEEGIDERIYFVCVYLKSISSFVWIGADEYMLGLHEYEKWPDDLEPPYPLDADEMDKILIIGNIYENPKYLNQ